MIVAATISGVVAAPAYAGPETGTLNVTATVPEYCIVSTPSANLDMGTIPIDGAAEHVFNLTIPHTCSSGVRFNWFLAKGLADDPGNLGAHRLVNRNGDALAYKVYMVNGVSGGNDQITNTSATIRYACVGSCRAINLKFVVQAQGADRPKGHYTDVLTLTLNY